MSPQSNPSGPRRHCMVVHAYYPVGETRVEREASALTERGFAVDVICLRGPDEPRRDTHHGVKIYRLPVKRHAGRGLTSQLMEYLAFFFLVMGRLTVMHLRNRYDTIQVHNLPDFLVFAALGPKLMGARVILDLHDLMPEFLAGRAELSIRHRMVRVMKVQEKLACRFADHVITVTDGWRDTLMERGVPPGKVSVMMNVADTHIFHRDIAPAPGDGFHLIYHGTFTPRYGVDLLVRAVALVRSELPDLRLTMLGDGEARQELVGLVREFGLTDHVVLSAHMLAAADLPPLLARADVGVVPNRSNVFTDGLLPTKLLEYVAMGIPVIAARTPTIASYFDDSMIQFFEPGDVDELAECIRTLYRDRMLLKALATNADEFNHRFDWPAVATAYADLVTRLGDRRAGRNSRNSRRADFDGMVTE